MDQELMSLEMLPGLVSIDECTMVLRDYHTSNLCRKALSVAVPREAKLQRLFYRGGTLARP